jgi:chromosome segregation ATPase
MRAGSIRTLAPALLLAAALAGCETTSDPSQGGFFSGVGALSTGAYDKRQQQKRETLENEKDKQVRLQREKERVSAQQASVAERRAALEKEYAAISADLAGLQAKVDAAVRKNRSLTAQADRLRADLEALDAQIRLARAAPDKPSAEQAADLKRLQLEKKRLEEEVDLALRR